MKIISHTVSGIGNRIKCLVGSLHFTDDVRVWWPPFIDGNMRDNHKANVEPFDDLFDTHIRPIKDRDEMTALFDDGYSSRCTWTWNDRVELDYSFDQSNIRLKRRMSELLHKHLTPSKRVLDIFESRLDTVRSCDYGCFVRTGDAQHNFYSGNFWSPTAFGVNKNDRAFIVGDSPKVYEYFMDFPNVVCYLEDNYIYGDWGTHIANAMLLGQLKNLRLPRSSTFSDLVFAYSKYEAIVDPVKPDIRNVEGRRGISQMQQELDRLKKL